jgi:hypothetical protein
VAKYFGKMSEMIDDNLSIAGDKSQEMSWKAKLSITLLVIGLTLFSWAIYKEGNGVSYLKIIGFCLLREALDFSLVKNGTTPLEVFYSL